MACPIVTQARVSTGVFRNPEIARASKQGCIATLKSSRPVRRKHVNLALQGGGAHGAFTWGVLDRLMRDGRIFIDGISGTSAGARNGVAFPHEFLKDGRQGAIDALQNFWKTVSEKALLRSDRVAPWMNQGLSEWNMDAAP